MRVSVHAADTDCLTATASGCERHLPKAGQARAAISIEAMFFANHARLFSTGAENIVSRILFLSSHSTDGSKSIAMEG